MAEGIEGIFNPGSLVVIGASKSRDYYFLRCQKNFKGKLYAVNPSEEEGLNIVKGVRFYKSILDIPHQIDYAILEVPKRSIREVLNDCGSKGVRYATVFTSGFSESGTEEGAEAEQKLVDAATDAGIKIIGPNCMGIYHPVKGMSFRFDLSMEPGEISFLSQSGGHALNFTILGEMHGIRFDKVVSYGNGAMIDSTDLIDYWIQDDSSKILTAYIEGVKDGRRFLKLLKGATQTKPIIIWKGGTTGAGASAVASHTGALAGDVRIWDVAIEQAGAVSVNNMEELIDTTIAFSKSPLPKGRRVAVVSISGGHCVVLTDTASKYGFEIPAFDEDTKQKLSTLLPDIGTNIKNPIDGAAAWVDPFIAKETILAAMEDDNIDSLLVEITTHLMLHAMVRSETTIEALYKVLWDLKDRSTKPFFVILTPSNYEHEKMELERKLIDGDIPVFPSFERAVKALSHLVYYKERGGAPVHG
ncbi:MAG: acetyl-CoA synthetase [Candidatus Syntrophoarchaeum sp. GoM_oil]|nr:MAG: acetyl-CoA synthetase [Candidatus Syntrophoarchaeum sp. GoM_oil]